MQCKYCYKSNDNVLVFLLEASDMSYSIFDSIHFDPFLSYINRRGDSS